MKCLIDSNVLISAWLFPGSVPNRAIVRSFQYPFEPIICQHSFDETLRSCNKKWPHKSDSLNAFLQAIKEKVKTVDSDYDAEILQNRFEIRDINDAPILAAAFDEDVDFIITGDKDFFADAYVVPVTISPANFATIDERLTVEDIAWD